MVFLLYCTLDPALKGGDCGVLSVQAVTNAVREVENRREAGRISNSELMRIKKTLKKPTQSV
jgi:hypothetical protein